MQARAYPEHTPHNHKHLSVQVLVLHAPWCPLLGNCKQERIRAMKGIKTAEQNRSLLQKWLQDHSNLLCHK